MHSRIFQISKMWIEKENYLNEDTLHQGDGSFYDYCAEIDDEERKEDIRYLVNTALPKDMFELVGDDTIRYIGGVEQWKENFVTNIRKKAEAITTENMLEFVALFINLKRHWKIHWILRIISIWTERDTSHLPKNLLHLWSLSVRLNRERYSISEESSTITSDTPYNFFKATRNSSGWLSSSYITVRLLL